MSTDPYEIHKTGIPYLCGEWAVERKRADGFGERMAVCPSENFAKAIAQGLWLRDKRIAEADVPADFYPGDESKVP